MFRGACLLFVLGFLVSDCRVVYTCLCLVGLSALAGVSAVVQGVGVYGVGV